MADNKKDHIAEAISDRTDVGNIETELKNERVPMYDQNALTYFNLDPNYHYRWVNDTYGRVERFIKAGYTIEEGDLHATYSGGGRTAEGQSGTQIWRTNSERDGSKSCLMKIRKDIYDADQEAKMRKIAQDEKEMDPEGVIRKAQLLGPKSNLRR